MKVLQFLKQGAAATLLLFAAAAPTTAAPAIEIDLQPLPGGAIEASSPGGTRGWEFDVTASAGIRVTHLGVFDYESNGLGSAHQVGLWNAAGVLLASATVPAAALAPLDANGQFRLVDVLDLTLPQGDGYAIAAYYPNVGNGPSADLNIIDPTPFVHHGAIDYVTRRWSLSTPSLAYPTNSAFNVGYFGASFELAVVPEPTALALAGWPLACLARRGRRAPLR